MGPGNVYVASAKRLLRGVVGIDSEAGPTEIGILADDTADPAFLAADLIAQAEHDANASCLLVTPDAALLDAVDAQLARQVPATRHRERVEAGRGIVGRKEPLDKIRSWLDSRTVSGQNTLAQMNLKIEQAARKLEAKTPNKKFKLFSILNKNARVYAV